LCDQLLPHMTTMRAVAFVVVLLQRVAECQVAAHKDVAHTLPAFSSIKFRRTSSSRTFVRGEPHNPSCLAGYVNILDEQTCKQAAQSLEGTFGGERRWSDSPPGCYTRETGGEFFFNQNMSPDTCDDTQPVCYQVKTSLATSTTAVAAAGHPRVACQIAQDRLRISQTRLKLAEHEEAAICKAGGVDASFVRAPAMEEPRFLT